MLTLMVEFLTGRYVATAFNDRDRAEWPPHPARLFSALVATHFDDPRPDERAALEWLERQGPPSLRASGAFERDLHTVFVPVNDQPAEPEHRVRQPRTFPSVRPNEPAVAFIWAEATPPASIAASLERLSARVVRLGHSSSLVSVRVDQASIVSNWRPHASGELKLRVPSAGQLTDLEDRFQIHCETEPRVMPAAFQAYTSKPTPSAMSPGRSAFSTEWIVFRRVAGLSLPLTATVALARVVRKIIMRFAEEPVPDVISGHRGNGTPTDVAHIAVVPLPFVGHHNADGSLLGVALVLPRDIPAATRRALFQAIARWERAERRDDEDSPLLPVLVGLAGVMSVVRLDDLAEQRTLRPHTWCGPARRWVSATPIALDRNPGDLTAGDTRKAARALGEAESTVRAACGHIGLPDPSTVTVLPSAGLAGGEKARHFPPFPGAEGRFQRVLTHAALEFPEPVQGPLLLGAGRYVGLGLMRPVDDEH